MPKLRNDLLKWYCCPCCGYPAFTERGGYEVCWLCNYEDDGMDDENPNEISGPNGDYTLSEMRKNFEIYRMMYRELNDRTLRLRISDAGYEYVKAIWGKYRWFVGVVEVTKEEINLINQRAV